MDVVIRAAIAFFFIFFLTRVIGRRELSSLQPFDLILLVVLGDIVQQGVTQSDYSVTGLLLAGATIAVLQLTVSYVSFRVARLRPLLEGEPIVLIEDGRFIDMNLERERLTQGEVLEEARQNQIGSADEIQWAVLETSGNISFITKGSS
jgi:uncharacterized membrane protein YcaP (DUF421 family)